MNLSDKYNQFMDYLEERDPVYYDGLTAVIKALKSDSGFDREYDVAIHGSVLAGFAYKHLGIKHPTKDRKELEGGLSDLDIAVMSHPDCIIKHTLRIRESLEAHGLEINGDEPLKFYDKLSFAFPFIKRFLCDVINKYKIPLEGNKHIHLVSFFLNPIEFSISKESKKHVPGYEKEHFLFLGRNPSPDQVYSQAVA